MSLATRLAVALVLVAVLATAAWGVLVRGTSRRLLEAEFESRMESATAEVKEALVSEATQLRDLTLPLCKRGTFFDKALLDYERTKGDLDKLEMGAQLALRHHAPDEAAARAFDELSLVTQNGLVLSSSERTRVSCDTTMRNKRWSAPYNTKPRTRSSSLVAMQCSTRNCTNLSVPAMAAGKSGSVTSRE